MYKIHYMDLSEKVYNTLKDMILKNEVKSGERLNQKELSRQLGVSRTPLLSAFSKLEKEMLVEIKPRRGAYVKKLTKKELYELYEIRLRLEPLGAYEAAKQATMEELLQLKELLNTFKRNVLNHSSQNLMECDYNFHMAIMKMSKNKLLYNIISSFNIIIVSNLEGLLKDPQQSLNEHSKLYNAIKGYNAEYSENLMYLHILDSKKRIQKKFIDDVEI